VEVRPATEDDQSAIRALHDAAFDQALEGDIAAALRASGEERI
jgi:predicted N-acetyltransferase YhbS